MAQRGVHRPYTLHVTSAAGGGGDVAECAEAFVRRACEAPCWRVYRGTAADRTHPVDTLRWASALGDALVLVNRARAEGVRLPLRFRELVCDAWHADMLTGMHTEMRTNIPSTETLGISVLWLQWLVRAHVLAAERDVVVAVGGAAEAAAAHERRLDETTWRWACTAGLSQWTAPPRVVDAVCDIEGMLDMLEHALPCAIDYTFTTVSATAAAAPRTAETARHLHAYVDFVEAVAHEHALLTLVDDDSGVTAAAPGDVDTSQRAVLVVLWAQRGIEVAARFTRRALAPPQPARAAAVSGTDLGSVHARADARLREWARSRVLDASDSRNSAGTLGDTFWSDYMGELLATWKARPSDGRAFARELKIASGIPEGAKFNEVYQQRFGVNFVRFWFRDAKARPPQPLDPLAYSRPDELTQHVLGAARVCGPRADWWTQSSGTAARCVGVLRFFNLLCVSDAQALFPWRQHAVLPAKAVFSAAGRIVSSSSMPLIIVLPWWQPLVLARGGDGTVYDASEGGRLGPVDALWSAVALWLALVHVQHGGAVCVSSSSAFNLSALCTRFCAASM